MSEDLILEIKDLSVSFKEKKRTTNVIRGVNLSLIRGKTLAIVGESGSGKSVTVKSVMALNTKGAVIDGGEILYHHKNSDGSVETVNITDLSSKQIIKTINGQRIAMVFQDPLAILNPTMTIGKQITEGMRLHRKISYKEAWVEAVKLLDHVGIREPELRMKQFPHQLSGGMRQRVVIAIALSCDPDVLICDEPTTALDVTIQARILELIKTIQKERGLSVIYITHDLGVVAQVADYVAVMYAGKVVEKGTAEDLFFKPAHPYTWGLLLSVPNVDRKEESLYSIPGNPPDLTKPIKGDAFAVRNENALPIDFEKEPPMFKLSETHYVASWLYDPENKAEVQIPEALKKRIFDMEEEVRA
ncbi:MAG: ABC transporter ATP-binding protein [Lachnospiraceae bacterium]|nr:ABC transporter ATP-binding protein [Lachnospiraceae bacterium]